MNVLIASTIVYFNLAIYQVPAWIKTITLEFSYKNRSFPTQEIDWVVSYLCYINPIIFFLLDSTDFASIPQRADFLIFFLLTTTKSTCLDVEKEERDLEREELRDIAR